MMTTDKALEILSMSEQARWNNGYDVFDVDKAIETIREVLERKTCEDVVSREEAIKVLRADSSFICTSDKIQAITDILLLSPVILKKPKGKWVLTQRGKYVDITCSCCGAVGVKDYCYNYNVRDLPEYKAREYTESEKMYFCKECGADMTEVIE